MIPSDITKQGLGIVPQMACKKYQLMAAFQMKHQQGHIRGRNAADTGSLGQAHGADLVELLTCLRP